MTSTRRAALAAGVLYLVTFVSSIPAVILQDPVFSDPRYVVGPGADTRVIAGAFLDLVNALAAVGTAVALYPVIRRVQESFAIGFVASRLYEAAVIMIGVVSVLAIVTLRQAGPAAGEPTTLVTVGRGLLAVRDWTFLLGPGLAPAINALFLATIMYRSRLVPRIIPTLGLIGAPLLLSSTLGTLFGINERVSAWTGIATAPIFLWELSLGLWMAVKGFRAPAATPAAAPTAGAAQAAAA